MIQLPNSKQCLNCSNDMKLKICSSCHKLVANLNEMNNSKAKNNSYILSVFAFFLWTNTVFGQTKEYKISGKYTDAYGFPVVDEVIKLKDTDLKVYTNKNGEFELFTPTSINTYVLVYSVNHNNEQEMILDESKLDQLIEIKLKVGEDEDPVLDENKNKLNFKDRVINTITWPYRKIRSTFFDNP